MTKFRFGLSIPLKPYHGSNRNYSNTVFVFVCVCACACARACFPKLVFGAKVVCMCPIEISV